MKKQGIIYMSIGILWLVAMIIFGTIGNYLYERDYESNWNLAEKASTIQQKAVYIDKFVTGFKGKGFEGDYNAVFFKTPDNSFNKNLEALESLKTRLNEIQKMNVASFEYQTAIQQITAQEQGEAQAMLDVFSGIWWKNNYFFLWDWVAAVEVFFCIFLIVVGLIKLGGGLKKVNQAMKDAERQRLLSKLG
jgi:hypothetical protein